MWENKEYLILKSFLLFGKNKLEKSDQVRDEILSNWSGKGVEVF